MCFAENLKELLDSKDIEIKELAYGTGISKNTIDNYLSGQKSIPNAENAVKIAKYLGTTVEYLVTGNIPENLQGTSLDTSYTYNIGQDGRGSYGASLPSTVDEFMIFDGAFTQEDVANLAKYYGITK